MKTRIHSVLTLFIFTVAWGALVTVLLGAMPAKAQVVGQVMNQQLQQPLGTTTRNEALQVNKG
jgi:hypothetical protein